MLVSVGAGQTGLQVAARFKQMNIRTIVVERNERVGDNWRKRYPTLSLNTPRTHHTRELEFLHRKHHGGSYMNSFVFTLNQSCTRRTRTHGRLSHLETKSLRG